MLAASDFVRQAYERDASFVALLETPGELARTLARADYEIRGAQALAAGGSGAVGEQGELAEPELLSRLRLWRRREMARIAWRDLGGFADVEQTLGELSAFADAAVAVAYSQARRALTHRYGEPRSASGEPQPLIVIGMGKLGGGELNFSSDIDLVLLFPEHGETDGARRIDNEEFFARLAQTLGRVLHTPTADGFVFRVDLRLRPFGESGPLVSSFASFEDYLVRHGRDWERYAWVKARALTGEERYVELASNVVRPFVYRRYLDFGVFESLREMKGLIEREVARRELANDIKLGPGGIREIEFAVQAFQLIRGGTDPRLQTPSLLRALEHLEGARLLSAEDVRDLRAAYLFLRRIENRLQMVADAQTHELPLAPDEQARLAGALGMPDWSAVRAQLDAHRARVSQCFAAVVFQKRAQPSAAGRVALDLGRLWGNDAESAALTQALAQAGFADASEAARLLLELRESGFARRLDAPGQRRLQSLLPALVEDIAQAPAPLDVLRRVIRILESIGQRSVYFSLLFESAGARRRLIELCAHGDFLSGQIAAHPLLLDELLDEQLIGSLPDRASLARDLEVVLRRADEHDPERQVEALRHFQRAAVFRIAVADLTGRLPIMQVSDRLTDVAELIVGHAMHVGWQQIAAQLGTPMCRDGGTLRPVRICAVGYGKLGGRELGYASDLDLVFLHDSTGEESETAGAKPVDNQIFFVRYVQRVVHLLTVTSAAGRLYEVDQRLRPSGKGGLLVTNISAFADYLRNEAWTWEHQALLHARAAAGESAVCEAFERLRLATLCSDVRRDTLQTDVRNMRERMRRELSRAKPGQFDIKQDPGGIADIEFLAQYWALRFAPEHPPVAMFSDTIRQLESVASADLVPQTTVDILTAAYRTYRIRSHHRSLQELPAVVDAGEFVIERAAVSAIWDAAMSLVVSSETPGASRV